jgi:hypothetical protein
MRANLGNDLHHGLVMLEFLKTSKTTNVLNQKSERDSNREPPITEV